jgi:hypothetical protein
MLSLKSRTNVGTDIGDDFRDEAAIGIGIPPAVENGLMVPCAGGVLALVTEARTGNTSSAAIMAKGGAVSDGSTATGGRVTGWSARAVGDAVTEDGVNGLAVAPLRINTPGARIGSNVGEWVSLKGLFVRPQAEPLPLVLATCFRSFLGISAMISQGDL